MANEQTQRINLELFTIGGGSSQDFTIPLAQSIRVFTHPFRVKLSSITFNQIPIVKEIPFQYQVCIERNSKAPIPPGSTAITSGTIPGEVYNHDLKLTEDFNKGLQRMNQLLGFLREAPQDNEGRPYHQKIPDLLYDGDKVLMRFPRSELDTSKTDCLYIQIKTPEIADMFSLSLDELNDMLKNSEMGFLLKLQPKPVVESVSDLYVHCDIAARSGYKGLPSDLIRAIRVPQDNGLVHLMFDDDSWIPGEPVSEIQSIHVQLKDGYGFPWKKVLGDVALTLSLEGSLYKTNVQENEEIPSK